MLLLLACASDRPPVVAEDLDIVTLWLGWGDAAAVELQTASGSLPSDATAVVELQTALSQTVGDCQVDVFHQGAFIATLGADWPSAGWAVDLPVEPAWSHIEFYERGWDCSSTIVRLQAWGVVMSELGGGQPWVEVALVELL